MNLKRCSNIEASVSMLFETHAKVDIIEIYFTITFYLFYEISERLKSTIWFSLYKIFRMTYARCFCYNWSIWRTLV